MGAKLTPMQEKFVDLVSGGVARTDAALAVGFSAPSREAYRLMKNPRVLLALRERREALIQSDLTNLAFDTLKELMTDKEHVPSATRYKAAELTLKMGRYVAQDAGQDKPKDLTEMNAEELAQAISSGMQALSELAGQLEGTHYIEGEHQPIKDVTPLAESSDFLD